MQRAGVVHRLIGHARRHRAVADDRDHGVVAVREVARHRHAEAGRDRGRGMRRAERVVFALGALGEAGQPAALAQRADAVAPAGEDLVRIGLMADVPDQPVARRVEHVVQRHRQLDHAEPGAEMAAGDRDRVDRLGAQLVGELAQVAGRQACAGRPACERDRAAASVVATRLSLVRSGGFDDKRHDYTRCAGGAKHARATRAGRVRRLRARPAVAFQPSGVGGAFAPRARSVPNTRSQKPVLTPKLTPSR